MEVQSFCPLYLCFISSFHLTESRIYQNALIKNNGNIFLNFWLNEHYSFQSAVWLWFFSIARAHVLTWWYSNLISLWMWKDYKYITVIQNLTMYFIYCLKSPCQFYSVSNISALYTRQDNICCKQYSYKAVLNGVK